MRLGVGGQVPQVDTARRSPGVRSQGVSPGAVLATENRPSDHRRQGRRRLSRVSRREAEKAQRNTRYIFSLFLIIDYLCALKGPRTHAMSPDRLPSRNAGKRIALSNWSSPPVSSCPNHTISVFFYYSKEGPLRMLETVPLPCAHYGKWRHMPPRDLQCRPGRHTKAALSRSVSIRGYLSARSAQLSYHAKPALGCHTEG